MSIDRTVLLSLIPMDRWASLDEIAAQLGQTASAIRERIADLIADGASIDVGAAGYRRYDPSSDVWAETQTASPPVPAKAPKTLRHQGRRAPLTTLSPTSFAAFVQRARIAAGLSQNALARLSRVDPAYVNRMEKGNRHPARPVVLAMASALDLDEAATDRFLYVAGLAPERDYQALYEDAQRRLGEINSVLTGWNPQISAAARERREAV
jgi:transcriptional regulator with XRE-family HTH domain/biotin operon repressor